MATRTTIGFLHPGFAAQDDYPLLEKLLGPEITLRVVHTSVGEDAHRVGALLDLGSSARLVEGAEQLRGLGIDAVVWACTSGSFVFGWKGARNQVAAVSAALGVPGSSTSIAFVHAARTLALSRVAVAATDPEDVASHFMDFLRRGGTEVLRLSGRGIITAAEVGALGRDEVLDLAAANDHPDAEGVLLPDTSLHTAVWQDDLEQARLLHDPPSASMQSGVSFGRLDHHGAAGGHRRTDLAGAHRHREVPRRDQQARPTGCLITRNLPCPLGATA